VVAGKEFSPGKESLLESGSLLCLPHNFKQTFRAGELVNWRKSGKVDVSLCCFFSDKEFSAVSKARNQSSRINTMHLPEPRTLVSSYLFPNNPKF